MSVMSLVALSCDWCWWWIQQKNFLVVQFSLVVVWSSVSAPKSLSSLSQSQPKPKTSLSVVLSSKNWGWRCPLVGGLWHQWSCSCWDMLWHRGLYKWWGAGGGGGRWEHWWDVGSGINWWLWSNAVMDLQYMYITVVQIAWRFCMIMFRFDCMDSRKHCLVHIEQLDWQQQCWEMESSCIVMLG